LSYWNPPVPDAPEADIVCRRPTLLDSHEAA
jgi:hypothetical protein